MSKLLEQPSTTISITAVKERTGANIDTLMTLGYSSLALEVLRVWDELRRETFKLEDDLYIYHSWRAADCLNRGIWSVEATRARLDDVMTAKTGKQPAEFGVAALLEEIDDRMNKLKVWSAEYKTKGATSSKYNCDMRGDELLRLKNIIQGMERSNNVH